MDNDMILILTVGIIMSIGMIQNYMQVEALAKDVRTLNQYDKAVENYAHGILKNNVSGVYFPGCGFFVDTRGRAIDDVNRTVVHEELHAFIRQYNDSEHFCG